MHKHGFHVNYLEGCDWFELYFNEDGTREFEYKLLFDVTTGLAKNQRGIRKCERCGEEIGAEQPWCLKYHPKSDTETSF